MTDERLAEIEAREQAATPGPWGYDGVPYNRYEDPIIYGPNDVYIAQTVYDMQSGSQNHNIDEDTIFIAHARQDIPDLIAEVKRLRIDRDGWHAEYARLLKAMHRGAIVVGPIEDELEKAGL